MSITPPLYDEVPAIGCTRQSADGSLCGRDASWHIIWTTDIENSLACDEHKAEAERYAYFAVHPFDAPCGVPGSVYIEAENRCEVDEDWLGLNVISALAGVVAAARDESPDT